MGTGDRLTHQACGMALSLPFLPTGPGGVLYTALCVIKASASPAIHNPSPEHKSHPWRSCLCFQKTFTSTALPCSLLAPGPRDSQPFAPRPHPRCSSSSGPTVLSVKERQTPHSKWPYVFRVNHWVGWVRTIQALSTGPQTPQCRSPGDK